jgi:uncharacterized lipoprotein YehR (DUF1307 family)
MPTFNITKETPMKMMKTLAVLVALLVPSMLLTACGDSNPIIGEWKIDEDKMPPMMKMGLAMSGAKELPTFEFTSSSVITEGEEKEVTYEVKDDQVIVSAKDEKRPLVITILNDDRIRMDMGPMKIELVRE